MYKNIFGCLLIMVFLIGCKEESKTIPNKLNKTTNKSEPFKRAFSDGDYNFQLEYNNRLDTSYFDVLYKGKKVSRQGYKGMIKDDFIGDLNKDKKNELYIIVEYAKQSKVYGYIFEDGRAIDILKEEHRNLSQVKSTTYKIERNQLVERFKTLSSEDKLENKILKYNLVQGSDGFELLPQGWHPIELDQMKGQYAARDVDDLGYYKVMILTQDEEGEWNINIKVKRNKDKKILCDFSGVGFFVNRDLIVPMKEVNPNLKGRLKIRFLDLLAIVYTEDESDSKEMISFCSGEGSIAGNFKKTDI